MFDDGLRGKTDFMLSDDDDSFDYGEEEGDGDESALNQPEKLPLETILEEDS